MNREKNNIFLKNSIPFVMVIFIALGGLTGCGDEATPEGAANEVMKNTAPIAKVQIQGDEPESAEGGSAIEENTDIAGAGVHHAGKATYDSICVACHSAGIPGIPQLGDTSAWAPRIEQGNDTLYQHAIAGYTGASGMPMPAKGGNPSLSDDAVKAAVDYIVTNSK